MSWLKKVGITIARVLGIVQKVEPTAAAVATALLPEFAPLIEQSNVIFQNIMREVVAAEAAAAAAGQAKTGPQKLAAVLANVGPMLDAWVAASFPGAKAVSDASKAGLVNAVVAVLNEIEATAPPAPTAPSSVPPAA